MVNGKEKDTAENCCKKCYAGNNRATGFVGVTWRRSCLPFAARLADDKTKAYAHFDGHKPLLLWWMVRAAAYFPAFLSAAFNAFPQAFPALSAPCLMRLSFVPHTPPRVFSASMRAISCCCASNSNASQR